jgi:hypothetical protein
MPKVPIGFYIDDVANDVCVAQIPKDKIPLGKQAFHHLVGELLFKQGGNNYKRREW